MTAVPPPLARRADGLQPRSAARGAGLPLRGDSAHGWPLCAAARRSQLSCREQLEAFDELVSTNGRLLADIPQAKLGAGSRPSGAAARPVPGSAPWFLARAARQPPRTAPEFRHTPTEGD